MKLQLLALVTIVATVTALPAPETARNTYEKRVVTDCDEKTLGKPCAAVVVEGEKPVTGECQKVSLICR